MVVVCGFAPPPGPRIPVLAGPGRATPSPSDHRAATPAPRATAHAGAPPSALPGARRLPPGPPVRAPGRTLQELKGTPGGGVPALGGWIMSTDTPGSQSSLHRANLE